MATGGLMCDRCLAPWPRRRKLCDVCGSAVWTRAPGNGEVFVRVELPNGMKMKVLAPPKVAADLALTFTESVKRPEPEQSPEATEVTTEG